MNFRALLTITLILALSAVGCSVREATPTIHKAPIATGEVKDTNSENPGVTAQSTCTTKPAEMGVRRDSDAPASVLLGDTLCLSAWLLSSETYQNRKKVASNEFFRSLEQFNLNLIKLGKKDPEALYATGILKRYYEILSWNCGPNDSCANLKAFRVESHLPQVLMLVAQQKPALDVREYYRVLRMAFDLGRADVVQDLNRLYLERHQELVRLQMKVDDKVQVIPEREMEELRHNATLLQNVLAEFDPSSITPDQLSQILSNFNPWDVSRRVGGMQAVGMDKLLAWAAKGEIYTDATRKTLDPVFVSRVQAILNGTDTYYGEGLASIYKRISAPDSKSKRVLTNFGLNEPIVANEYFYLIDRLYYNHFTVQDAEAIWVNTNRNKEQLFKALNLFVRLQVVNMIVWTNTEMESFFVKSGDRFKDLIQLLRAAVSNSVEMHAKWERAISGFDVLKQFATRQYAKTDRPVNIGDDPYWHFSDSLDNLRPNIKMLSVYPNMMMIVYLMAKKNFNATIMTWFGPVTITSYDVIKWFFIDVMAPWFNFGTDSTKLQAVELLYSIHFALMTETFSAFNNDTEFSVNEADFFQAIVQKLITDQTQDLIDQVTKIKAHNTANRKYLEEAIVACTEEAELQPKEQAEGKLIPRSYARSYSYEQFNQRLQNGYARNTESQLGSIIRFHSTTSVKGTLNKIRSVLEVRMLFVRNMLGIMKDYMSSINASTEALDAAYDKEVKKYYDLRAEVLDLTYDYVEKYGECDKLLYKHEVDIRNAVLQLEEVYLGKIFDRLVKLNELKKTVTPEAFAAELAAANAEVSIIEPKLPEDFTGYDAFIETPSSVYFAYHKIDGMLRLRRVMKTLAPNTVIELPNFQKLVDYNTPEVNDLRMPTGTDLAANREAFINLGMKEYVEFLSLKGAFTPNFLTDKLDLLSELYRFGPVDEKGYTECGKPNVESIGQCREITPERIIQETFDMIEIANLTPYDAKIVGWLSDIELYGDSFFEKVALEKGSRDAFGYLDLTFQRIASDDNQVGAGSITSYFFEQTLRYYVTEQAVGMFFFAPRPTLKGMIRSQYQTYVDDYQAKVERFISAVNKWRDEHPEPVAEVRRTVNDVIPIRFEMKDGKKLPVYLTPERLNRYTSQKNIFHEKTGREFKKAQ